MSDEAPQLPPRSTPDTPPSTDARIKLRARGAPAPAAPPAEPPPLPGSPLRPPAAVRKIPTTALIAGGVAGLIVFGLIGYFTVQKLRTLAIEPAGARDAAPPPKKSSPPAAAPATATKPAAPHSPAAVSSPASAPVDPAPVAAATPAPATVPEPDPQIEAWIRNLKLSAVRRGTAPRLLIEGKTFNLGDTLDATHGVIFSGYDPERDLLRFTDRFGATYERRSR